MDNTYILGPDGELYHWGIKGMKWGVRRYQNKDGSLTAAGKKHISEKTLSSSEKTAAAESGTSKEFDHHTYTDMFEDEIRSGAKGLLYEYAKAQKDKWDSEGTDSETTASEKLVSSYAKLKVDYLKRTASEPAMQFLKDNPNVLTSVAELMKTDFNDPRRKEYVKYDSSFEISLDNLYETDVFYDYMNDKLNHSDIAEGELIHWGIKGMKWGIRRYQNEDGSLTPAGKKRYAKLEAEIEKLGGKSAEKKLSEMTDEEVAAKTNRMRLENNLKEEMRKSAEQEQRQRKLQESLDETSTEELRNKIARLQLEEQYKNLKNPKKPERDPQMEKLQKEVDRLALEKRYRDLQKELNPPKKKEKSFISKLGEKAVNEVLVPSAMNAGKSYLDKLVNKYVKGDGPNIDSLLKKYGDMSDEDYERYKRAAAVKGWEQNILGKKNKEK